MYCELCASSQNGKYVCDDVCPYGADEVAKYLTKETENEVGQQEMFGMSDIEEKEY